MEIQHSTMANKRRIKVSKNFFLDEYVTPEFYAKWGVKCIWWIRPELITVDQFIRDRFGIPSVINNWWHGFYRDQSGLRYPEAEIGAGDSLHKFGCASDNKFQGKDHSFYDDVRADIIANFVTLYKPLGLTTMEVNTPNWLHKDCRNIKVKNKVNIIYHLS